MEDPDLERKLSGRTLQVYLYLQHKKEPSGIREIQRSLGLSSPSVADYQVEKLIDMKLAAKDRHGRVSIIRKVKVKELDSYVNFGRFSVPRLAFYASVFSAVAALYVTFNPSSLNIYDILVPVAAAAIFWIEAWKMWKFSLLEKAEKIEDRDTRDTLPLLVPSMIALMVFAIVGAFLFQYAQEPSDIQVEMPPVERAFQQSIEESIVVSEQKVAVADSGLISSPEVAILIMSIAGSLIVGILIYMLARYRHEARVLAPEQLQIRLSGTQDYPESLR